MADGSDIAWLGLERHGDGRWSFELTEPLSRFDGKLYGGTGAAVSVAAMEAETGRPVLWATTQFAASAEQGDRIDVHVEELARGRRASQARITATVAGRLVFVALGASAERRSESLEAQFGTFPPGVPAPDDCEPWRPRPPKHIALPEGRPAWLTLADLREVERDDERGFLTWGRMEGFPQSQAGIAFRADTVPSSVVRAAGRLGAGTSLDNSVRFSQPPETPWVLVDYDPYFASGGYVHGAARVWSEDGALVAVASQTAAELVF